MRQNPPRHAKHVIVPGLVCESRAGCVVVWVTHTAQGLGAGVKAQPGLCQSSLVLPGCSEEMVPSSNWLCQRERPFVIYVPRGVPFSKAGRGAVCGGGPAGQAQGAEPSSEELKSRPPQLVRGSAKLEEPPPDASPWVDHQGYVTSYSWRHQPLASLSKQVAAHGHIDKWGPSQGSRVQSRGEAWTHLPENLLWELYLWLRRNPQTPVQWMWLNGKGDAWGHRKLKGTGLGICLWAVVDDARS